MPDTCATCSHWRIPVSETRRVCALWAEATDAGDCCDCHSEGVPFTDDETVDDDTARAEWEGQPAIDTTAHGE